MLKSKNKKSKYYQQNKSSYCIYKIDLGGGTPCIYNIYKGIYLFKILVITVNHLLIKYFSCLSKMIINQSKLNLKQQKQTQIT